MKIGIVTFWESNDNYGQQLQCWALQQFLLGLGHTPFLIRYSMPPAEKPKDSLIKSIARYLLVIPQIRKYKRELYLQKQRKQEQNNIVLNKKRKFPEFREQHIFMSNIVYYSLKELQENPPSADIYICGSDQIWAYPLNRYETTAYFLNFGDKKIRRVAYAPSFGTDVYPKKYCAELKNQLRRFDAISCREPSGTRICEKLGLKSTLVLDPTLLLKANYYLSELCIESLREEKYIFIYSLNITKPEDIYWNELKNIGLSKVSKIIVTPASGYIPSSEIFEDVEYVYAKITEWLSLIKYSSLIVTSSFHGIVFSILFHKSFVFIPLKGLWGRANGRILSLLSSLGLSDCVIDEKHPYQNINNQIDWISVDNRLDILRQHSYDYLKNI